MKTYKLNNIEVSEVELRNLIKSNPELLKEESKSKYFTPKIGEEYARIHSDGEIFLSRNDSVPDKRSIVMGAYRTTEEAELARDKQLALVRMWNYADENYYFRPDWDNEEQSKYEVYYDHREKCFCAALRSYYECNFLLPYFKSREDSEQFIKDNQKDLELFIK